MTRPLDVQADRNARARPAEKGAPSRSAGGAQAQARAATPAADGKEPAAQTRKVDFCILGAGVGARLVALKAAEAGASVILVVPPAPPAGLPGLFSAPLALVEAGNLHHAATASDALRPPDEAQTLDAPRRRPSGEGVVRHLHLVGEALAVRTADARLRALRVSIVEAQARFEDARAVRAGDLRIVARSFVLESAPEWDIPPLPGINEIDYLTPDRPLIASRPVEQLVVIGLSDAGLALAQAHRRLGAIVTLLPSPHDDPRRIDDEVIRLALNGIALDGVALHPGAAVTRIEARGREAVVHARDGERPLQLGPAQVLLAPRLRARFADPDWAAARIELDGDAPARDAALRTSNRRVRIIGAGTGGETFSFHLERDADFIVDSLLAGRMPAQTVATRVIPTTPAVAILGLDEDAARRAHGRIAIMRAPYAHHAARLARHRGLAAPAGELKVIATRRGRIVGCAIAGDGAAEIAGLWSLAIARRLQLDDVGGLAFPDISRHSLTRRATRQSVVGWPLASGPLLRLLRLWRKIAG